MSETNPPQQRYVQEDKVGDHHRPLWWPLLSFVGAVYLVLLIAALLLPVLIGRPHPRGPKSSTQLRGIHQAMVTFAEQNNGNYPGLTADGKIAAPSTRPTNASFGTSNGMTVEYRIGTLLDKNFFTGEYVISPFEDKVAWTTGPISSANYSYSTLKISDTTTPGETPSGNTGRRREWKNKLNSEAAILSDRARGGMPGSGDLHSVQNKSTRGRGDHWEGGVVFNDNHSVTENTYMLNTKYGSADNNVDTHGNPLDNIFLENDGVGTNGDDDANAYMIHSGATKLTPD